MQIIKEALEKDKSAAFGILLGFLLFAIEDDTWLADKEVWIIVVVNIIITRSSGPWEWLVSTIFLWVYDTTHWIDTTAETREKIEFGNYRIWGKIGKWESKEEGRKMREVMKKAKGVRTTVLVYLGDNSKILILLLSTSDSRSQEAQEAIFSHWGAHWTMCTFSSKFSAQLSKLRPILKFVFLHPI